MAGLTRYVQKKKVDGEDIDFPDVVEDAPESFRFAEETPNLLVLPVYAAIAFRPFDVAGYEANARQTRSQDNI